ncbi:MAG: membrane protein insertion efficiency factor YidD [bacterium]|nr:membrane protein insertion efficiency factor YidD [bacterium]
MKKIIIYLIKKYQSISFRSHYACKYIPTCSNYAIEALEEYGLIYGIFLTIKRILRCNPFSKGGIDPVPKRRKYEK